MVVEISEKEDVEGPRSQASPDKEVRERDSEKLDSNCEVEIIRSIITESG